MPTRTPVSRSHGVTFAVTPEIVERATVADSSHCMIAEAIRLAIPGAAAVSVDLATIRFSDRKKGERYLYLTPPAAQQALIDFDQGRQPAPFTFRMRRAQVVPILSRKGKPNLFDRPDTAGPAHIEKSDPRDSVIPVKRGGELPPVAVLSNARGRIRQFGLRQLKP